MTKQEFIDWFYSQKPYFPTPDVCYDKLVSVQPKNEIQLTDRSEQINKLKEAANPLLKLLCQEYHPHHTVIVTGTSVELLEGVCSIPKIFDYLID